MRAVMVSSGFQISGIDIKQKTPENRGPSVSVLKKIT